MFVDDSNLLITYKNNKNLFKRSNKQLVKFNEWSKLVIY